MASPGLVKSRGLGREGLSASLCSDVTAESSITKPLGAAVTLAAPGCPLRKSLFSHTSLCTPLMPSPQMGSPSPAPTKLSTTYQEVRAHWQRS